VEDALLPGPALLPGRAALGTLGLSLTAPLLSLPLPLLAAALLFLLELRIARVRPVPSIVVFVTH
jgi:hypothetical protein